jgi:hypothetical protein
VVGDCAGVEEKVVGELSGGEGVVEEAGDGGSWRAEKAVEAAGRACGWLVGGVGEAAGAGEWVVEAGDGAVSCYDGRLVWGDDAEDQYEVGTDGGGWVESIWDPVPGLFLYMPAVVVHVSLGDAVEDMVEGSLGEGEGDADAFDFSVK